jgi:uncharacterized ion transporter superfamily protein YfcC
MAVMTGQNFQKNPNLQKKTRQTVRQILMIPALLAVLSAGGLVFALVEDGIWDALSWATLSVPIALLAICITRGRA